MGHPLPGFKSMSGVKFNLVVKTAKKAKRAILNEFRDIQVLYSDSKLVIDAQERFYSPFYPSSRIRAVMDATATCNSKR